MTSHLENKAEECCVGLQFNFCPLPTELQPLFLLLDLVFIAS